MAQFNKKGRMETPWLSISDLMTILMFLFLLCSVAIIGENNTAQKRDAMKNALIKGFSESDLKRWGATIDEKNGDVHITHIDFDSGKFDLKSQHKDLLNDFFPKYINGVSKFSNEITDIKIEGHTDSDGLYLMNLRLSQDRSREVLAYLIQENLPWERQNPWFFKKLSASGRSESQIIYTNTVGEIEYTPNPHNAEDKTRSRRVVFRFILRESNSGEKSIPIERITITNEITITNNIVSNALNPLGEAINEVHNPPKESTQPLMEEGPAEASQPDIFDPSNALFLRKKKGAKK